MTRALLGQNQYGKAETRVVRIVRDGATHHIRDLNVSVSLSGEMTEVHYSGSNASVLPTDTTKNTVYAFAKEYGIDSAEQFGIDLARHFVASQETIHQARVRIEEFAWERIANGGEGEHSFVRKGQETRLTQVTFDGSSWEIVSGLKDLTVLNSTNSEFWGYVKDQYTTLPEAYDRILATDVTARWRFNWSGAEGELPNWQESYEETKRNILEAFAETYSLSLQQTLYAMGARVVEHRPEIDEIRFSLPNKHHFLVDLKPFGLKNDNEVYFAADRPYGLIEATILRDGAEARIPVDLTNL
ncbi:factor-independent urate hydroxylase [Streptomyces acidiscabies]|uniref:Uricase n=1 Tax=Streptomyces acidiscabies TaxID=42234 RepID=A0AAP6EFP2_9ACTN|nr:urate oxidase [Streptomyces acidiscabies]MBP5935999.1 urate oxidase [Streptomyces sp. LBUM 1476]MBZ3916079.1 urate oxidase [Streptomyces acidiscabies]MDX2960470.1 urate oxidase [Streptomyces acidiscabies]MDX3017756.1 urate oxidase [Streptomyces acidiscabies]MDX3794315.1 urate oxidase [Streptomyces acidiscabies]